MEEPLTEERPPAELPPQVTEQVSDTVSERPASGPEQETPRTPEAAAEQQVSRLDASGVVVCALQSAPLRFETHLHIGT